MDITQRYVISPKRPLTKTSHSNSNSTWQQRFHITYHGHTNMFIRDLVTTDISMIIRMKMRWMRDLLP